jgi:hypothetical protein
MSVSKRGTVVSAAVAAVLVGLFLPARVLAQQPCPCPPTPDPGVWIGSVGAGLALTSGNSDTMNVNVAFDVTRDPKTRNVMKATGLFLRGEREGDLITNRLSFAFRDQYAIDVQ